MDRLPKRRELILKSMSEEWMNFNTIVKRSENTGVTLTLDGFRAALRELYKKGYIDKKQSGNKYNTKNGRLQTNVYWKLKE